MIQHTGNGITLTGTVTVTVDGRVLVDSHDLAEQIAEQYAPGEKTVVVEDVRIRVEQLEMPHAPIGSFR